MLLVCAHIVLCLIDAYYLQMGSIRLVTSLTLAGESFLLHWKMISTFGISLSTMWFNLKIQSKRSAPLKSISVLFTV